MKKTIIVLFLSISLNVFSGLPTHGYQIIDIGFIYDSGTSNLKGLAVDPTNSNIFLTSLSYGGQDNLWEFTSDGNLINSVRANWNTGSDGNLAELTIANNGHLFVNAARDIDPDDGLFERYVVEMSQDGATIYSSFSTTHYFGGKYGLTYDPSSNHLLIGSGRFLEEFLIREITLNGTQLNVSVLNPNRWPWDIAYDPFTDSIFSIRPPDGLIHFQSTTLDRYKRNSSGNFYYANSYDLSLVSRGVGAIDINRSNGMFYVSNNQEVIIFDRTEIGIMPCTLPIGHVDYCSDPAADPAELAKATATVIVSVQMD